MSNVFGILRTTVIKIVYFFHFIEKMKKVYRIFFRNTVLSDPYFVLFYSCDLRYFDVVLCPSSRKILATPLTLTPHYNPNRGRNPRPFKHRLRSARKTLLVFLLAQQRAAQRMREQPLILVLTLGSSSDLTIRYDTRCYFNVRSEADVSQLNLPHGTNN